MLLQRVNQAHFPEDPALQNVSARRGNIRNCSCNRESQTPPRRDGSSAFGLNGSAIC